MVSYIQKVSDVQQWSPTDKQVLANGNIRRNLAWYSSGERQIRVCIEDCDVASDEAIVGAFVHEIAHAYQERLTPSIVDAGKCNEAGDLLPVGWGFCKEIQALKEYRKKFG